MKHDVEFSLGDDLLNLLIIQQQQQRDVQKFGFRKRPFSTTSP